MKAIMVMFDSLRRDLLSCYGGPIRAPNFERLAAHSVRYDKSYAGSLPCMPARRELHTGRYNFLHRGWGPLEPFDDSMPELLRKNGVYTYLTTDHYHYLQDGGATYHNRYSAWTCSRGQESDAFAADPAPRPEVFAPAQLSPGNSPEKVRAMRRETGWQNHSNRLRIRDESDYPMRQTFDAGLDFLRRAAGCDSWFLQLETFDPHEPFTSPERHQAGFLSPDDFSSPDWPPYAKVSEPSEAVQKMRAKYQALVLFCDEQLGRVLDEMDRQDLWRDTMLIVNTDHGFFLGEHGWWGKGTMPDYEELVHTPLFIWDPRSGERGVQSQALVQTIDLAPTLLDYFHVEIPRSMRGLAIKDRAGDREAALFGYFGGPLCVTDGRYVLMRGVAHPERTIYEYTLMPAHMKAMFSQEELMGAQLADGREFTHGVPVLRIPALVNPRFVRSVEPGTELLFDLETDPGQECPIQDEAAAQRLREQMLRLALENDVPAELLSYYGLPEQKAKNQKEGMTG